jgi:type 2A phosphatase activator TIP41
MSRPPPTVPPHKLFESPNSRTIEINGWSITATTNAISNAHESDTLQAQLGFALPEMTFGNNTLELLHQPSGWRCAFNARDALACVRGGEMQEGDGAVKVGYADAWLKSRYAFSICEDMVVLVY